MKKKKVHTIFWWTGGGVILLVSSLQALLFFFGDEILRESILVAFREYAKERFHDEKTPELDFGELRLNLLGGTIEVSDLTYQNGLPLTDSLGTAHTLYRISTPHFMINGLHLWEVYYSREIQLDKVRLVSPDITITKVRVTEKADSLLEKKQFRQLIDEQETRIYNSIREYTDLFAFNKLEITDAAISLGREGEDNYQPDVLTDPASDWFARRLTIVLQNFRIDSLARQEQGRLLFTKNIQVKLGNYQLVLPDSSYALMADTLSFSTQSEKLRLQDLAIIPLRAKDSANWYSLRVPMLEMTGVDALEMYHEKTLLADTLLLKFPQVKGYWRMTDTLKSETEQSFSHVSQLHPDTLYTQVSQYWQQIGVNRFNLTDGQIQFFKVDKDTVSWLDVPQHSLSFTNFWLAPPSSEDSLDRMLPADSLHWQGRDIRLWFTDFQHYFTLDRYSISTDQPSQYSCNLVFDSARVQPRVDSLELFLTDSRPPPLGYDIRTSQVEIFGVDLANLSSTKFADIDSIQVQQPQVAIANFSDTPFSDLPRRSLPGVIDTAGTTIKQVFYNWSHARLNLYPVIAPNRPDAWLEQMLVQQLNLNDGQIEIMELNNQKSGFTEVARIDKLQGYYENVSIGNEAHPLIAIDDTLQYSSRVAVFADEVDMALYRSWFQFPYNRTSAVSGGWLEAEEIALSTLSAQGYVRKVNFWPNRLATRFSPSQMKQMDIPYFAIQGINFGELYNLQVAKLDQISLVSPTIKLGVSSGNKKFDSDFSMANLYSQVEPYLNQLSVDKLEVQQANITLQSNERNPKVWFATNSLDVSVMDFLLDNVTTVIPERPFYAREARIAIDTFTFSLSIDQGVENFAAEQFLYSSYSDRLTIDNLRVLEDSVDASENDNNFIVEQLALDRMNFYRYFTENEMEVEKVMVRRPEISIVASKRQSSRPIKPGRALQAEIYPKIKSVTQGVYVDLFAVEEGKFSFLQRNPDTLHHIQADTLTMRAHRLAIDSVSYLREAKMFFADEIDFHIHIDDYLLRLPQANQSVRADELRLDSHDDKISVKNLEIRPYGFPTANLVGYPDRNLLSLTTPFLQIVGLNVGHAFTHGELNASQINLTNPIMDIYRFAPESSEGKPPLPRWSEVTSPHIHAFGVDQINFTKGTVNVFQKPGYTTPVFASPNVDISLMGLQVDSVAYRTFAGHSSENHHSSQGNITRKLLMADDLQVRVHDYQITMSDTMYTAKAGQISLSTKKPQLEIRDFSLVPQVPRYLYKDVFPFQKTRASVQAEMIRLSDIDVEELIGHRHLKSQSLLIDGVQMDVFKDARVPRDAERKLPMHQEMLTDLDFQLTLDTVRVTNGFISYAERVPDASQDGIITFEQFSALLQNVTNHPDQLADSVVLAMEVGARVMGEGQLEAIFYFPMASPDRYFTVNGKLDSMDLQALNPIMENAAFIHIRDGEANSMRFFMQGNREESSGELWFNYNDLSILLVDKSKGRPGIDERVGSLIANAFVVKSDNPKAVLFRVGEINYEHDPSRSVFSYWWRSLLSGIKSSIGMERVAERVREESVIE
ncbi:MAG: hypothetical protein AAF944_18020 [Bacteroidota bacterium]